MALYFPNPYVMIVMILKYLLEGIAVSVAAFVLHRKNITLNTAIGIAGTAALIFAFLDHFTSGTISHAARWGGGFGVGTGIGAGTSTGPIMPA